MEAFATLGWDAWATVAVVLVLIVALVRDLARPDLVMMGGLAVLLLAGIVSPRQAFQGFSNSAVLTVGALYVVAAGVQSTNALSTLDQVLFTHSSRMGPLLARFMLPTSVLSGLINNTPIVAMLTPRLQEWADEEGIPASKLLIPLSYAAIAGGMTTLVGTSTNLIVAGLMEAEGYEPLGLFDVTWIGVPAVFGVIGYFVLGGHRLLPDRGTPATVVEDELERDMFEVKVTVQSPIIGKTVSEAGLRDLGDAFLTHVRRGDQVTQATPRFTLEQGDVLAFNGNPAARERLLQRPGLKRNVPQPGESRPVRYQTLPLYEAVIAESSDLVGKTLREANFREEYQGVVLGIQRKDRPVTSPVGGTRLKAGDLLIVEAPSDFQRRWSRGSREEFFLVAPRDGRAVEVQEDDEPARRRPRQKKKAAVGEEADANGFPVDGDRLEDDEDDTEWGRRAPLALALTGGMVLAAATGLVPIVTAAFTVALLMVLTGCVDGPEAQNAINIQVLFVIAAALGIGQAVEITGLADALAGGVLAMTAGAGPIAVLATLYVATNLLTEIITNNAAAVLMLPVSMAAAANLGAPPTAFGVVVAVAASASFITPIGYQTNLMVMAPGGYRFSDYARAGWPVTLIVMAITIAVIHLVWL
jgi:di/tricarboxylate transporter